MIDERLKQIADHYGLDEQLNILQEECAELIQAASKYKRTREYPDFDQEKYDCGGISDTEWKPIVFKVFTILIDGR